MVQTFWPVSEPVMNILCPCGFDCSDFIAHHQIPADAQFNCPACDNAMRRKSLELAQGSNVPESSEMTSAGEMGPAS
jgi:hypothetical protein